MLGANPFIGLSRTQLAAATGRFLGHAARRAPVVAGEGRRLAGQLADVVRGSADIAPDPKDRRFGDDMYRDNPLYRRLAQAYVASCASATTLVSKVELDRKSEQRAKFALSLVTEALAPTNTLAGNPAAMRKAVRDQRAEPAGRRCVTSSTICATTAACRRGRLGAVPAGANLAVTPGAVVYRDEVLELHPVPPTTETVYARPLLDGPAADQQVLLHGPGARAAASSSTLSRAGIQFFTVSWRNPTPDAARLGPRHVRRARCCRAPTPCATITGSATSTSLGAVRGRHHDGGAARPPRRARGRSRDVGDASASPCWTSACTDDRSVSSAPSGRRGRAAAARGARACSPAPTSAATFALAAAQRPGVELLGQQLPARQRPAGVRHPRVERRLDQPAGRRCTPSS